MGSVGLSTAQSALNGKSPPMGAAGFLLTKNQPDLDVSPHHFPRACSSLVRALLLKLDYAEGLVVRIHPGPPLL
jgi:hypothetical protein